MNLRVVLQSRRNYPENRVTLILHTDIEIYSEVMAKTVLMLVAEVGGYLGLTLGVSLIDLKLCFSYIWIFIAARLEWVFNFKTKM